MRRTTSDSDVVERVPLPLWKLESGVTLVPGDAGPGSLWVTTPFAIFATHVRRSCEDALNAFWASGSSGRFLMAVLSQAILPPQPDEGQFTVRLTGRPGPTACRAHVCSSVAAVEVLVLLNGCAVP